MRISDEGQTCKVSEIESFAGILFHRLIKRLRSLHYSLVLQNIAHNRAVFDRIKLTKILFFSMLGKLSISGIHATRLHLRIGDRIENILPKFIVCSLFELLTDLSISCLNDRLILLDTLLCIFEPFSPLSRNIQLYNIYDVIHRSENTLTLLKDADYSRGREIVTV